MNVLWHGDDPVGICVFGFGPLSSSGRNLVFGLRGPLTSQRARWVNRTFASVVRLVLDPRYRGAGLAAALLRRCCELVPWPWIELVSEMAGLVPFCEAAGFRRVARARDKGRTPASRYRTESGAAGCYGRSGWTEEGFRRYYRHARYSRPVYYLFDNRRAGRDLPDPEPTGNA